MIEQAPDSLGGDGAPTWQGHDRAEIEICVQEEKSYQVWLDSVRASDSDYETKMAEFPEKLNGLLRLFDIDPVHWSERVTHITTSMERVDNNRLLMLARRAARHGTQLGTHWWSLAFYDFDMEYEEEGGSDVVLSCQLSDSIAVDLVSSGSFWTMRDFKHPKTGEIIGEDMAREIENATGEEVELKDSAIDFDLRFEAYFSKIEASK